MDVFTIQRGSHGSTEKFRTTECAPVGGPLQKDTDTPFAEAVHGNVHNSVLRHKPI